MQELSRRRNGRMGICRGIAVALTWEEGSMIGVGLLVNRQEPIRDDLFDLTAESSAEVLDLSCYRKQSPTPTDAVEHCKKEVLVFLGELAPSVDDVSLSAVLDRVADAWARSRARVGA
jgi:hypothetical protein